MKSLLDEFFHYRDDRFDRDLAIKAVAIRLNISSELSSSRKCASNQPVQEVNIVGFKLL